MRLLEDLRNPWKFSDKFNLLEQFFSACCILRECHVSFLSGKLYNKFILQLFLNCLVFLHWKYIYSVVNSVQNNFVPLSSTQSKTDCP